MQFSRELRPGVALGRITVSVRLWSTPKVRVGGRYTVGASTIEIDTIELMPFSAISDTDIRSSGENDRESLRRRAAHAGPVDDNTLVFRIEFHLVL